MIGKFSRDYESTEAVDRIRLYAMRENYSVMRFNFFIRNGRDDISLHENFRFAGTSLTAREPPTKNSGYTSHG